MNKIFLLVLCLLATESIGQENYEQSYKKAISFYKSGQFALAMNTLTPLISAKYQNGITPFAHYYYALAAYKTKHIDEARQALLQLRERFPSWQKMDEVRYLIANIAFEEKQFGEGLDYLEDITDASIKRDADMLRAYYIAPIQDLGYLKNLNRQFPADKVVALTLVDLIQKTSNDKADLELSDRLTNKFGIPNRKPISNSVSKNTHNYQKGYFNVSVLLPYKLKEFNIAARNRTNQFAFDLYEGMKIAKAKLQQEGILINLFNYDVGSNAEEIDALINNSNFLQSDLIIGPVYNEPAKIIADFVETNQRFFVHPTTLATDILMNHPRTFLLQSSFERQAQRTFSFMKNQSNGTNRKVAIYYGAARKDSVLAAHYKIEATKNNYLVIDFRKTREKLDSTSALSDINRPAHVAIFSSTEGDGAKVANMLNKRRLKTPIIASLSAYNVANTTADAFGKDTYFLDTEFVDISKPQVKDFQTQYFNARNTVPSTYVMQGYDALLFFGRMLQKYQEKLRIGLDMREYDEDYLLSGFDYQQANNNQIVPILQIEDNRLVRVNY